MWLFAVVAVALIGLGAVVLLITAADAMRPWFDEIARLIAELQGAGIATDDAR